MKSLLFHRNCGGVLRKHQHGRHVCQTCWQGVSEEEAHASACAKECGRDRDRTDSALCASCREEEKTVWTFSKAQTFLVWLRDVVRHDGFDLALAGSVLFEGRSRKDLDVVIFPLDTTRFDLFSLASRLLALGFTCVLGEGEVKEAWRRKGSTDDKRVEIWKDPSGRRVDFFFLR